MTETKKSTTTSDGVIDTELNEKAKKLMEFLAEEPAAQLVPFLSVSHGGIIPSVKIERIKANEDAETVQPDEPRDS